MAWSMPAMRAGWCTQSRTDGAPLWTTQVDGPVTDSILLMHDTLVFGDLNGNIYRQNLTQRRDPLADQTQSPHLIAAICGSATPAPGSPNLSGVAVANAVVYFQSMTNGYLYALDERTGAELA